MSRRIAHLQGVATGAGAAARRHPLAWVAAALVPGIGPYNVGAIARVAIAMTWPAVVAVALWHGYQQLARAGLVEPIESRFENKIVPLAKAPAAIAPLPPPTPAAASDVYARLDADLRRLGQVALNRYRKLGGIPCEVGNIAALDLNFRANRYAFSCDEAVVYTVIEPGEFEAGRAAHLRSYNWRENKFATNLPPVLPAAPAEPAEQTPPKIQTQPRPRP